MKFQDLNKSQWVRLAVNYRDARVIIMQYVTNLKCKTCRERLNIDEIARYKDLCFSCCSKYHAAFESAHSGVSNVKYKRIPISKELRDYIFSRDKHCLKCKTESDLTIDHINPVSSGGENHHSNLQLLCRKCNSKKCDYPEDYREVIE